MDSIRAVFSGAEHSRDEILRWEDHRIDAAAQKLGCTPPPHTAIEQRRQAWADMKMDMGTDEMMRRLTRDRRLSQLISHAGAAATAVLGTRRRFSVTQLHVPGRSAHTFAQWFHHAVETSDDRAMLVACPDHYVVRSVGNRQEVVETTGGSRVAGHFFVDFENVSSVVTPADPAFPVQITGVARTARGLVMGGVRHQFRDNDNGLVALLTIEFPPFTPSAMVQGHQWHLACEFSNWIEASA